MRTTFWAAARRATGISRTVPKSGGSVTPRAESRRWARTAGASGALRSGSWTFAGISPID